MVLQRQHLSAVIC